MELARHWRLNAQRYTLTGTICACCGKQFVSARPVCDVCHTSGMSAYTFGQREVQREELVRAYDGQR